MKVLGMHDQLRDLGRSLERTNLLGKSAPVDNRQRVWDPRLERINPVCTWLIRAERQCLHNRACMTLLGAPAVARRLEQVEVLAAC